MGSCASSHLPSVSVAPLPAVLPGKQAFDNVHNYYIFDKDPLRRGSRWVLHRVTHVTTGKRFVCKSIQKTKLCSMEDLAHLQVEIEVHRKLSQCRLSANAEALLLGTCASVELQLHRGLLGDPNIAQLIDCYEDSAQAHIIMEECAGCDLFERVRRHRFLAEPDAAAALTAVLTVVQHCHGGGVVHRGIQPESFMYEDESPAAQLKAIDFSTAALVEDGLDDEISSAAKDLVTRLLTRDPKRRITASQALKHSWFTEQRALRQEADEAAMITNQPSSPKAEVETGWMPVDNAAQG